MYRDGNRSRAALYLRVSTGEQTFENQRPALEQMALARGLEIVASYEETASARGRRPAFGELLEAAHRGEFAHVLVWAIDRLGRDMAGVMQSIVTLDRCGVRVLSHRESWLDTDRENPMRGIILALASWVAQYEREVLVARTVAGLERARREGKTLGRPERVVDMRAVAALRAQGVSLRKIAQRLHVPKTTLVDHLHRSENGAAAGRR